MGKQLMERKDTEKGFSLMESLISLFLFLLVILFSFDCFHSVRSHFFELKTSEEWNTAAYAALDRMKRDLLEAGWGLTEAAKQAAVEGISEEGGTLILSSKDEDLSFRGDLVIGQQRIEVEDARPVKKGHEVCIFDSFKGEVHSVASADKDSIVLLSPLAADYVQRDTHMVLLRKISLFFDERRGVIRRKVNLSPAQPLLEEVNFFGFEYIRDSNLVRVHIKLKIDEEKNHEAVVFPKNTGMLTFQGK
jgi:hypothetical protein